MKPHIIKMIWIGVVLIGLLFGAYQGFKHNKTADLGRDHTWYVDINESTGGERLVRGKRLSELRGDMYRLLIAFNRAFEAAEQQAGRSEDGSLELPRLRLLKVEAGTAQIEITNSDTIAGGTGSSGGQGYLASATFTLTESPAIKAVEFLFPAGEHAMPGVYTRESFSGFSRKAAEATEPVTGQSATVPSAQPAGESDGKDRL